MITDAPRPARLYWDPSGMDADGGAHGGSDRMKDQRSAVQSVRESQEQPHDAFQLAILRVWQRLLWTTALGIDDDFFGAGGTFELAERMLSALTPLCEERLSLADIERPVTVRRLAGLLVDNIEKRAGREGTPENPARHASPARPQDILQDQLAALWEGLLGCTSIGIDDDFASIGGTAALAEQMADGVAQLCGQRIPLDQDGPVTVRTIADRLLAALPRSLLTRVQEGIAGVPPLFLLHGDVGGGGYYVRELARELGTERPVYALAPHGLHADNVPRSVEEMAADHARGLSAVYPHGRFHLGGHCACATLAWETAQRLAQGNRDIASLILIEPTVRAGDSPRRVLPPPRLSPAARRLPRHRVTWLLSEYLAILARYRFQPYSGKVVVFWASEKTASLDSPERRAWLHTLASDVDMRKVPGSHVTALGRHVRHLAAAMKQHMLAADA